MEDKLITLAEVNAWIAARPFQDIQNFNNVAAFMDHLADTFGEREYSEEAQEALYARYPRIMRRIEEGGI